MFKSRRQKFIDMLANLSSGGLVPAQQSQVKAFQHYYNMNTPVLAKQLVAIDEAMLSGMAARSTPISAWLIKDRVKILNMSFNAFGGVIRWVAAPDQRVVDNAYNLGWEIEHHTDPKFTANNPIKTVLSGHISYIDDTGVRYYRTIDAYKDILVPWVLVTKVTVPVFAKLRAEGKMKMENGQIYQRVEP